MTTITTGTHQSGSPILAHTLLEARSLNPYAALIVYRILRVNNGFVSQDITRVGGNQKLTRVVRILVESGLIYTISVIVFFGTFLASNNAQYGVSDVVRARHPSADSGEECTALHVSWKH